MLSGNADSSFFDIFSWAIPLITISSGVDKLVTVKELREANMVIWFKIDAGSGVFGIALFIFSIASGIFVFWEGRSRFLSTGNYLSYYSQWRPSVLIYTILVGLFFYYIFEYLSKKTSVISKFSTHSFFVFFVHVAVLELMWTYLGNKVFILLNGSLFGKLIFDPIFFAIVALVSFLIARFMHKIPKSGRLLG